jgi:hypothetical protein
MVKEYQTLRWKELNESGQEPFTCFNVDTRTSPGVNIYCKPCKIVLFRQYPRDSYNTFVTVEEQQHIDSDEHQENLLMERLAGDSEPK